MNDVRFAVVGHPNKGKSSIVSTLSRNDSIAVSPRSGTTTQSQEYIINIADARYSLIDTPGFQRPRQLLHWLKQRATDASQRAQAVHAFLDEFSSGTKYPDEVELLTPIMAGAAIIYVVDGSHPYGPEYEAEMEILRWCGQPRLALVNPIHSDAYIDEWKSALDQYFSLVQVFDPFKASVSQQAMMLENFRVIAPDWTAKLATIAEAMKREREQLRMIVAEKLANYLIDVCSYEIEQKLPDGADSDALRLILKGKYQSYVLGRERELFNQFLITYKHMHCNLNLVDLDLPPNLFDTEQWFLWGLNKKQLLVSMTVGGMVAGGSLDLATGGASALAGTLIGGVTGLTSGLISTMQLDKTKFKGFPLAGKKIQYGPIRDPNYPYVLINRAMHLHMQVVQKNHADRSDFDVDIPSWELTMKQLDDTMVKKLHNYCGKLSRQSYIATDDLSEVLKALLIATENN